MSPPDLPTNFPPDRWGDRADLPRRSAASRGERRFAYSGPVPDATRSRRARRAQRDRPGVLALVGGDEFKPGNEPQDELLVRTAESLGTERPAFIVASAAARQDPDRAVATARNWFAGLGLVVEELPLRTRRQGSDSGIAEQARSARFVYLAGGDPGLVVQLLASTPAWAAIVDAWRAGAVLAGSSAGAMAMGSWTLIRARHPGDVRRDARQALELLAGIAVAPHFDTFGHRWVPEALPAVRAAGGRILGLDERTAAVWADGEWRAMGAGGVTLIGDSVRRFAAGEHGLPLPSPATPAVIPPVDSRTDREP